MIDSGTFAGSRIDGAVSFGKIIYKRGTGTLTLAMASSSALGTGGTVTLSAGTTFSSAPLVGLTSVNRSLALTGTTTLLIKAGAGNGAQYGTISGTTATLYLDSDTAADVTGSQILGGNNTFTTTTEILVNRGSLSLAHPNALGNAANSVQFDSSPNATLAFGGSYTIPNPIEFTFGAKNIDTAAHSVTLSGVLSGPQNLTKLGTGTLILGAANTHTGIFNVSVGTLLVNGSLSAHANPVNVAAPATLGGSGTIQRPVSVSGTLAPGNHAIGTLTATNTTTFAPASTMALQLGNWNGSPGTGFDSLTTNALAITATNASRLTIELDTTGLANFSEVPRSFPIVAASAPPSGLAADNWTVHAPGFPGTGAWSLQTTGNLLELVYTPTPFGAWASSKGLSGSAAAFDADPDHDGTANGLEFILGTEPNPATPGASTPANLPQCSVSNGDLVLTYTRHDQSVGYPVTVEFSETLDSSSWTTAVDPANATISTVDGTPFDTTTVRFPMNGRPKLFARLKAATP